MLLVLLKMRAIKLFWGQILGALKFAVTPASAAGKFNSPQITCKKFKPRKYSCGKGFYHLRNFGINLKLVKSHP